MQLQELYAQLRPLGVKFWYSWQQGNALDEAMRHLPLTFRSSTMAAPSGDGLRRVSPQPEPGILRT
jgi:hypothetical protein